jgi:FMN phosphatase YigB (HAD superfamily)
VIDALLLDLGNVLVFHDDALLFARLGERAGLTGAEASRRLRGDLWTAMNTSALDEEGVRREVTRALDVELEADEFFALFNSHFIVNHALVEAVGRWIGRFKLGLLSNTNAVHARFIRERLPILRRFDAVLLSCEEGVAKPDPRFFHAALARLGSAPQRTLFVDDIMAWVEAARALRIRGELFTNPAALAAILDRG